MEENSAESLKATILAAGAELGLGPDDFLPILKEALSMANDDVQALRAASASADFDQIKTIAHRLKGTFANLRCEALAQIMRSIDAKAIEKRGLDEIKMEVEQFVGQLALLKNI